ncbi:3-methyladenine DNA glycosylase [Amylibacter ulvae]|uniref:DNA-3-methyladenine glycosylase II n=1 Tax=Paramylibacter ulvae TaxID=1651968 RepID=A0ABQ3CW29_9RHOB|nr:DNA-3-methyladenine glycosylase 2 family protein [Amylibacter ulvae]GHA43324.1 3-methyladenine DNA glycosylase [Amylibacter ulvae]
MTVGRIIETDADVAEGAAWLAAYDPRFEHALEQVGKLPLRRRGDGFQSLLDAICGQQISIAAAASICQRLADADLITAAGVANASVDELRACGLSRPKVKYAQALATSGIDFNGLRGKADADVIAELITVKGIGTWSAEIYAMFSLGRADVFAHGDLALQEAAKNLFDLPGRPNEKQMRELAADWSPWRGVAARLLWAYYRVLKNREGIKT